MKPTILIIGGGFSGISLTHALSRLTWREGVRIVIVDRSGHFGRGAAYSTTHPSHLLNVPAGRMGALADDEEHFLAWLRRDDPGVAGDAFVPRSRYGDYLEDVLRDAITGAADNVSIETLDDDVIGFSLDASGRAHANLSHHGQLAVDRAVLAIGNLPPRHIPGVHLDDDRCVRDPWEAGALKRLRGIASALVVGTGLTMVDAVLLLYEANPGAHFVAVSRRGLLPLAHRDHHPARPGVIDPAQALAAWDGSAGELLRIIRSESRRAEANGQDWRDVVNGLRSMTAQLWRRMPPEEQARFFRHVRPFWDAHRHRMSTHVAARVEALIASGQLSIVAGRIAACARDGDQVAVDVQRRN